MKISTCLTLLPALLSTSVVGADEDAFESLRARVEQDVLEIRAAAEAAYLNRCASSEEIAESCESSNYHTCGAKFPNPVCLESTEDGFYGRGNVCNANDINSTDCFGSTWDFSVSAVRVPPQESGSVTNTICTTQPLEEFFVAKREADRSYWLEQGMVDTPWMYFGAEDGVMRLYPARPDEQCDGTDGVAIDEFDTPFYEDPREHTWYKVSDPQGPRPKKNVVLLLDNSGSMNGTALQNLKESTKDIINNLHDGDRVAVMPFNHDDETPEFYDMIPVTDGSKEQINAILDEKVEAVGATNMFQAFTEVFDLLDTADLENKLVDALCPTVTDVVFLTDYRVNYPNRDVGDLMDYFSRRFNRMKRELALPKVNMFWMDISQAEGNAIFAFRNADVVPGLSVYEVKYNEWEQVTPNNPRANGRPIEMIRTFTDTKPLPADTYANVTSWVRPYTLSTNGARGISVSSPVFDRSVKPPRFVGVVGMDLPASLMEQVMGDNVEENFEDKMEFSTLLCPAQVTAQEQLELLEPNNTLPVIDVTGSDVLLGRSAGFTDKCGGPPLPADVFANFDGSAPVLSYAERACCSGNENDEGMCINVELPVIEEIEEPVIEEIEEPEPEVEKKNGTNWALVGGLIGAGVAALLIIGILASKSGPPPAREGEDVEAGAAGTSEV